MIFNFDCLAASGRLQTSVTFLFLKWDRVELEKHN